jgi:hypothetical protein
MTIWLTVENFVSGVKDSGQIARHDGDQGTRCQLRDLQPSSDRAASVESPRSSLFTMTDRCPPSAIAEIYVFSDSVTALLLSS